MHNPNRATRGGALESTRDATIANKEHLSDYIEKLQRLKPELVQLGRSMTNARQELVKARRDLDLAQNAITHNRMDGNLIDTVKKCTERVINWNEMEGNMLRQRAKAKHQNRSMSILQKGDGTILTEQSDIHNEVMEFYKKLMGSTASNLRHIDIQAMRDGKQITFDQGAFLTATVTEAEIVKALQGIGDLKAPDIDDDVLLHCRGDEKSIEMILKAFSFFSKSTGLQINPAKCKVFCGGLNYDSIQVVKNFTGFEEGTLPVRYLGVPLSCKKLNVHHYLPLVEKIVGRIRHWSSKLLSIAGRIQLVRSIITAIAQYWMSVFPMPKKIIQKIDSICRLFIWSGNAEVKRKSPVAWKQVCKPTRCGGLNLINLELWNLIVMLKCLWNICSKDDNLWVKWIHAYFLKGNNVMSTTVKSNSTWILKSIMKQRPQIWIEMLRKRKFSMKQVYMELVEDHNRADWFSLCKEQDEDLDHLMFSCRVTKAIWLEVLKWMDIDHTPQMWRDEVRWLCNIQKEKDGKGKF
ncbi:putative ribonuclease H protein [Glycine soja]